MIKRLEEKYTVFLLRYVTLLVAVYKDSINLMVTSRTALLITLVIQLLTMCITGSVVYY